MEQNVICDKPITYNIIHETINFKNIKKINKYKIISNSIDRIKKEDKLFYESLWPNTIAKVSNKFIYETNYFLMVHVINKEYIFIRR